MNIIKPKTLRREATVGFLTASGSVRDMQRLERAKLYFINKGYNVLFSDTTYEQSEIYAGDDDKRLCALYDFFLDPNIDAIFCTRGGYGAIRLLNKIDYKIIEKNPKLFCGFSDATAFLTAIYANTGLVTYHSPMPYPDFGNETVSELTEKSFFEILEGNAFSAKLEGRVYKHGFSCGILWGGNLATLASMVGTCFVPNEKFILFIEDVNEPAYKIDRYLTQLMFDKNFINNLAGVILGEFSGVDDDSLLEGVFEKFSMNFNIPVISGLKIGHVYDKITVPVGIFVKLDTTKGLVEEASRS